MRQEYKLYYLFRAAIVLLGLTCLPLSAFSQLNDPNEGPSTRTRLYEIEKADTAGILIWSNMLKNAQWDSQNYVIIWAEDTISHRLHTRLETVNENQSNTKFLTVNQNGVVEWRSGAGGGTMNTWLIAGDTGSPEIVADGETATIAGGTNISTVVSPTRTLTVNWSAVLNDLTDVNTTSLTVNDVLTWNGSQWVNQAGGGGLADGNGIFDVNNDGNFVPGDFQANVDTVLQFGDMDNNSGRKVLEINNVGTGGVGEILMYDTDPLIDMGFSFGNLGQNRIYLGNLINSDPSISIDDQTPNSPGDGSIVLDAATIMFSDGPNVRLIMPSEAEGTPSQNPADTMLIVFPGSLPPHQGYMFTFDQLAESIGDITGKPGSDVVIRSTFESSVSPAPATGAFRLNSAPASANSIYIDKTSENSVSIASVMSSLLVGDKIYIQDEFTKLTAYLYEVTSSPSDNGSYISIPVSNISSNGGTMTASNVYGFLIISQGATAAQTLSYAGLGDLSISGGNSVDLSDLLDNTDSQTLSFVSPNISISGGNSVDISGINTDNQALSWIEGTSTLSITGGNSVVLSGFMSSFFFGDESATIEVSDGNTIRVEGGIAALADISGGSVIVDVWPAKQTVDANPDLAGWLLYQDASTFEVNRVTINSLPVGKFDSFDWGDGSLITTITDGEAIRVTGGTNITTTLSSNDITVDWSAVLNDLSDVSAGSPSNNDVLTWNGSAWVPQSAGSGSFNNFTIDADTGTPELVSDGETVTYTGGTGISTTVSATRVITINLDAVISDLNDVSNTAPTSGQVLKWNGSAWVPDTDLVGGGGGIASFNVAGSSGPAETVTDGETITIAQGTGITTVTSSPNTVTVSLSAAISDLTDVNVTAPSQGEALIFDGSEWINQTQRDSQTLVYSGAGVLQISNGNSVNMNDLLDNTDNQILSFADPNLSISGGNSVDISGINTDNQTLSFANPNLSISGGNSVDLTGLNTDNQMIEKFVIESDTLKISIERDAQPDQFVVLTPYLDNTDNQQADLFDLSVNTLRLSLENDGVGPYTVDLSQFLDNTDSQQLSFTFPNLSITGGNSVDLSILQDGNGIISALPVGDVTIDATDNTFRIDNLKEVRLSDSDSKAGLFIWETGTTNVQDFAGMASDYSITHAGLFVRGNTASSVLTHYDITGVVRDINDANDYVSYQVYKDSFNINVFSQQELDAAFKINLNEAFISGNNEAKMLSISLADENADGLRFYDKYNFPNATPSAAAGDTSVIIWQGGTQQFIDIDAIRGESGLTGLTAQGDKYIDLSLDGSDLTASFLYDLSPLKDTIFQAGHGFTTGQLPAAVYIDGSGNLVASDNILEQRLHDLHVVEVLHTDTIVVQTEGFYQKDGHGYLVGYDYFLTSTPLVYDTLVAEGQLNDWVFTVKDANRLILKATRPYDPNAEVSGSVNWGDGSNYVPISASDTLEFLGGEGIATSLNIANNEMTISLDYLNDPSDASPDSLDIVSFYDISAGSYKHTEIRNLGVGSSSGGGGGSISMESRWLTTILPPPGTRRVNGNNLTQSAITEIYIDKTSLNNVQIGTILLSAVAGDQFYIQEKADDGSAILFELTADPSDNVAYVTYTGTVVDILGDLGNNQDVVMILFYSGGMNDWSIAADVGGSQVVADGETVTILGGTGFETNLSAGRNVTVNAKFEDFATAPALTNDHEFILVNSTTGIENRITVANVESSLSIPIGNLSDVNITSPSNGQVLTYNGSAWVNQAAAGGGTMSSFFIDSEDNTPEEITDGETIDIVGGTGIGTTQTGSIISVVPRFEEFSTGGTISALDFVFIETGANLERRKTAADVQEWTEDFLGTSTLVAGTNMTITYNDVAGTITFDAAGGGGTMSSFEFGDGTGTSTVSDGQTISVTGGYGLVAQLSGSNPYEVDLDLDFFELNTTSSITASSNFILWNDGGPEQRITSANVETWVEGIIDTRTPAVTTQTSGTIDLQSLQSFAIIVNMASSGGSITMVLNNPNAQAGFYTILFINANDGDSVNWPNNVYDEGVNLLGTDALSNGRRLFTFLYTGSTDDRYFTHSEISN